MTRIKVTAGCRAGGKGLAAGKVYRVPGDVSAEDAKVLISTGRAVPIETGPKADNREKDLEASASQRGLTTETAGGLIKGRKGSK